MKPPCLSGLPDDVLQHVVKHLTPREVVCRVGATCYRLYAVAATDGLWQAMFREQYATIINVAFQSRMPLPLPPLSWRAHFFSFENTWMLRAKEEGRVLMTIAGHVYDATDYVDAHPGLPSFLLSAAGTDATTAFLLAGHSDNARTILRQYAVPELDAFRPQAQGSSGSSGSAYSHAWHSAGGRRSSCDDLCPTVGRLRGFRDVLRVLLGSADGRRKVLDTIGSLLSASLVDLERTGREPARYGRDEEGDGSSDDLAPLKQASTSAGIQRFLPVVWHLSCVELSSFSWLHRQPTTPAALLDASRSTGRRADHGT